ncbi:PREDICTED: uncharacterized protein LOC108620252 [Drosophila arizonae]|uniref:Uncharacterized protein LOC108620252 n=1 Tax=Drosophila arizonae TaxID=7263 RepID=A0ABM1PZL4_DROAR|nr:PREDICTED: uncharacterized protein LOC108620252 [Drosophila arizonae]XP_017872651.1 PREDICTED: uncharacterized protein LOC108620252 [Drosophila arizonae]
MASITFKGRPTVVLRTYQVVRIGNNAQDKSLDFCLEDKSVAKLHATLTRSERGLFLVNESSYGTVSMNGQRFSGPILITFRDAINGIVYLRFGRVEAFLRVSGSLGT